MDGTEPLQADYRRDGIAFAPGALDMETLRLAEAAWQWSMEHPGPLSARLIGDKMIRTASPQTAKEIPSEETGYFYQDIPTFTPGSVDAYREVLASRSIIDLLLRLFAPADGSKPDIWFLGSQVFLKEGGDQPPTGWHQDSPDIGGEGLDMAVLWMSFDTVPAEGALEMVSRSHSGPTYSSIYGSYSGEPIPDIEARRQDFEIVSYACEPGDVVIFHPAVLHGGGATRVGQRRRSLALRFFGPDCRVAPFAASERRAAGAPFRSSRFLKIC